MLFFFGSWPCFGPLWNASFFFLSFVVLSLFSGSSLMVCECHLVILEMLTGESAALVVGLKWLTSMSLNSALSFSLAKEVAKGMMIASDSDALSEALVLKCCSFLLHRLGLHTKRQ